MYKRQFLRRVWGYGAKLHAVLPGGVAAALEGLPAVEAKADKALRLDVHTVLKQIDYDYQRMQYNTVVSGAMKLLNALEGHKSPETAGGQAAAAEGLGILLRTLYPVTPHIAHAMWRELGYEARFGDLLDAPWPTVDESALVQDEIEPVSYTHLTLPTIYSV